MWTKRVRLIERYRMKDLSWSFGLPMLIRKDNLKTTTLMASIFKETFLRLNLKSNYIRSRVRSKRAVTT